MKVKNPSFLLGRLGPNTHSLSKCFMPDENNVYLIYMIFAALPLLSLSSLEDDDDASESKILAHLPIPSNM
jgi:hypothetical protein